MEQNAGCELLPLRRGRREGETSELNLSRYAAW